MLPIKINRIVLRTKNNLLTMIYSVALVLVPSFMYITKLLGIFSSICSETHCYSSPGLPVILYVRNEMHRQLSRGPCTALTHTVSGWLYYLSFHSRKSKFIHKQGGNEKIERKRQFKIHEKRSVCTAFIIVKYKDNALTIHKHTLPYPILAGTASWNWTPRHFQRKPIIFRTHSCYGPQLGSI